MYLANAQQWGAAAFVIGNVLFIVNKLNEMSRLFLGRWMPDVVSGQDMPLIVIGQAALIVGYVAYYRHYVQRVDRSGAYALRLICGGGIVLAIGHASFMSNSSWLGTALEPFFLLVILGLTTMLAGLIWFGVQNLRRPVLGRWPWLPLATGLMGFTGFFLFSGEEITAVFLAFRTLFALGLIGLGLVLWLEKPARRAVSL